MYEWSELIKLWEREQVKPEQVIGQLLKHGEAQQALLTTLQRRLEQVEQTVTPQAGTPPTVVGGKSAAAHR